MGWNSYQGLELCKLFKGDKKGKGRVLLSVAVGLGDRFGVLRWAPQGQNYTRYTPIKPTIEPSFIHR
ncbi:MAG: hypothetical protein K2W94_04660 [Alphaproteobacteria bacterium]|nr:hypothetical protein [Alphaproteobacteria bacterium]